MPIYAPRRSRTTTAAASNLSGPLVEWLPGKRGGADHLEWSGLGAPINQSRWPHRRSSRHSLGAGTDNAPPEAKVTRPRRVAWWYFVPAVVVSLLTMPLTAVWFLQLGFLVLMVTAAVAGTQPEPVKQQRILLTAGNVAGGLLVGPGVYLLLWVLPL